MSVLSKFLYLFFVSSICFSCNQNNVTLEKKYFDLKGFINSQISDLKRKEVKINKTWILNDATETKLLDSLNWEKELVLFSEADINKKAFLQSYNIKIDSLDNISRSIIYTLKPQHNLPVKKILLKFDLNRKLSNIDIENTTKNYLSENSSHLSMILENGYITGYEIETNQKLFFGKNQHSVIKGKLIY